MAQVKLDAGEIKDFLNHILKTNNELQGKGLTPVAVEVNGPAGLGKTSIISQLAKENNLNFVKLNLAQLDELADLIGFPLRQFQLTKADQTITEPVMVKKQLPNGQTVMVKSTASSPLKETIWVDENALVQYTTKGYIFTGNKRMSYAAPEWISDKQGGGILCLDDWTRADLRFSQSVMELIDKQEYISWKLPKGWTVILTANPDDGTYLVNSIDVAQRTRFISVEMKWNSESWAEWAEKNGIDGRAINFVLSHPEVVTDRVNPRALTTFFNCISSIENFEQSLPLIQMIGEGSVGPEVATMFTVFINNRMDKLIDPKTVLLASDFAKVEQGLKDAILSNGYRADIASILLTRIINYSLNYAENNSITPDHVKRLTDLVKHPDIFTNDLKYHLVKKIINGNKNKFGKLLFDKVVQDYATK